MKRPAICFCLCISILGWAGVGHAKGGKSSKSEAAPAAAAAAEPEAAPAEQAPAPAAAPADSTAPADTVTPEGDESNLGVTPEGTGTGDSVPKAKAASPTTLSWQDIVVVPRKAFIKSGRFEFMPLAGLSVNDNLIRHYIFGGEINYFLSDVFSIGIQGQYFVKNYTQTAENVGLQYNRIPTLNRYLYGGALIFGYAPLYGKFALFNQQIMHWEIYASGGVGITVSEIIPRNPGDSTFKNNLLTPNVAVGARFFLFNWLTVNVALRDYILPDKFEPANRAEHPEWDTAAVKANATQAWVNNLMLYAGVGIYLPTKFSYKTPR